MGRPTKQQKLTTDLADLLVLSLSAVQLQEVETAFLIDKAVKLLSSKDQTTLAARLIEELKTRDLTELPANVVLTGLTNLLVKTKIPPEDQMSLAELSANRQRGVDKKENKVDEQVTEVKKKTNQVVF